MPYIPTPKQAKEILKKYNSEEFHIRHGEIVSGVMGYFAQKHDPEQREFWESVGMLHDVDFEQYPDEHCVRGVAILRGEDIDESLIASAMSHGWGMTASIYEPREYMEKVLFAIDELSGLIGAAAIMRPSRSVADIEVSSVKKKFKDKKFAAGCSREVISQGAEMLGMPLEELIQETILGMRTLIGRMDI